MTASSSTIWVMGFWRCLDCRSREAMTPRGRFSRRRGASRVDDRVARRTAACGAGTSGLPDRPAFRSGHPVSTWLADPTADHRHGRYGQCREPASGSGQGAALPRRHHGGSFSGGERRGDRRRSIQGSTRRSLFRFAVEQAIWRFASETEPPIADRHDVGFGRTRIVIASVRSDPGNVERVRPAPVSSRSQPDPRSVRGSLRVRAP